VYEVPAGRALPFEPVKSIWASFSVSPVPVVVRTRFDRLAAGMGVPSKSLATANFTFFPEIFSMEGTGPT
jgi:hypothetical protein